MSRCRLPRKPAPQPPLSPPQRVNRVNLSDSQLESIKVGAVGDRDFPVQREAVGSIDFNQDMNVQVFTLSGPNHPDLCGSGR
jgi:hypothetical protein